MGKAIRTLILAMAATLAVASCTEKVPEDITRTTEDSKVYLKIGSVTTSELTKAAIEGTKFPTAEAATIGLFIGETNNKAYSKPAGSDSWTDPEIELPSAESTLYGYYPYSSEVTSVGSIPVSSSIDGDDWMWAMPVEEVSSSKPDVSLSMNHALALVEVTFNITGYVEGAEMIALSLTSGSFAAAGTLDATDGSITAGTYATDGCQLLAMDQVLTMKDGAVVAKCLLVPTGLDGRQDMTIACTLDGKNLKATLSGDKGVVVKGGTKSTVSLNVKGTTMEVASVGVSGWNGGATTAIVGGHSVTVTGNVPAEIAAALDITTDDESVEKASSTATVRYDKSILNGGICELVYSATPASCRIDHNATAGTLTISDVTKDIEIALSTKVADWDEIPVLSGIFTVDGSGRKVRFSTGLLYWDGDSFEIESGQLSFYGYYLDTSHISHFFWSKDPAVSCQAIYSDSEASADDVLFTNSTVTAANPYFTAGELKGFWRALSNAEWNYLINTRVVNGGTGEGHTCVKTTINERPGLIIFCDGYTGATENLTSIPEDCAFLPICGYRQDEPIQGANIYGYCWSSTSSSGTQAYCVNFRENVKTSVNNNRNYGFPIRLVVDVTE